MFVGEWSGPDGALRTNDVKIALISAGHSSRGHRAALGEHFNQVNCQKMASH